MRTDYKKTLFGLLLLLLLPVGVEAETLTLEALMGRFAEVKERRASYTEAQHLSMLDMPLSASGTLLFRAPDYLEKRVDNGGGSYRVEGQQLLVDEGAQRRRIPLSEHPALGAFVAAFRATLAGDLATLGRHYHLELKGERNGWTLLLRPKRSQMAQVVEKVSLSGREAAIERVEILERGGDRTVMRLHESDGERDAH
ncbi:MAG: LolA-related protein [Pseudomonadota bacterium]